MSKENYLARYKSPNIVIIPTTSLCYPPSPKRSKVEIPLQTQSPQHVDLSFLDDFNIDEIVECLNNCDNNDTTIEKLTDDNERNKMSLQSNENKVIVLNNENETNIKNNGQNSNMNELVDCKNVQNTTFNTIYGENELQSKETIHNILDTENPNVNIHHTDTLATIESNSVVVENISVQLTCAEKEIIEKDKIQCDFKEGLDNDIHKIKLVAMDNEKILDSKEPEHNKMTISVINTKESKENILNFTQSELKSIKNVVEDISKRNDVKQDKECLEQKNGNNKSPKSVIQRKTDILYEKLESRMFNYLHVKYSVESIVHCGKFSKIFKCKDSAGKQYAVKMINKPSDRFCLGIEKEKMIMNLQADIPKENLFCVYFVNSFSHNGYWCFLMDFYPKNLKEAIVESQKPFHIDLVQGLARQLVAAVTLLRNNNIVHSDIKPSHIMLNSSNTILKLCGFDCSYYIKEANISPNIGSVNYRAPEVLLGYSAGFSIDVWSTGLVLHEMATGRQLFPGHFNCDILYKQMCTLGNIPHEMLQESCYRTRYFVGGMFKKRIGAKGKKTVLMHKFNKNDRLSKTVYGAYYNHWEPIRTKTQKTKDFKKIKLLLMLLEQMLLIRPNHRITIEFVYANPFMYEMFDS